jgi:hypothetical protein
MMINRLKDRFDHSDDRPPKKDYFVVVYDCAFFYVAREVAERILQELQADVPPRWLRFIDINGSSVCVRTRLIEYVQEYTQAQRAAQREFRRARRQEDKADRRPWEDDDD